MRLVTEQEIFLCLVNIASEYYGYPVKRNGHIILIFEKPHYKRMFEKIVEERFGCKPARKQKKK